MAITNTKLLALAKSIKIYKPDYEIARPRGYEEAVLTGVLGVSVDVIKKELGQWIVDLTGIESSELNFNKTMKTFGDRFFNVYRWTNDDESIDVTAHMLLMTDVNSIVVSINLKNK